MLRRLQGFIIGFFTCAIFSGFAFAATQSDISVTFNNIKLAVRGQIVPTDTELFVYNNRTYGPVRFVGEALGLDVKYNEITDTVEMTDKVLEPTANSSIEGQSSLTGTEEKYTPDGIKAVFMNNEWYLFYTSVNSKWNNDFKSNVLSVRYSISPVPGNDVYTVANLCTGIFDDTIILKDIPIHNGSYIEYDYYVNTVLPLIK